MKFIFILLSFTFSMDVFGQKEQDSIFALPEIKISVTKLKKTNLAYSANAIIVDKNLYQGTSLNELTNLFAGLFSLSPNNYAQDTRLSSRGYGARSAFGIRGIKIITDDLPDSTPDGQAQLDNIDFTAISSVELLRGPYAGMYGNNSGGVLNIYTVKDFEKKYFEIGYKNGSFGMNQFNAGTQFSIHKLNVYFKYNYLNYEGFRQWSAYKNHVGNIILNYKLNEKNTLKAIYNYVNNPLAQDPGAVNLLELEKQGRQLARDRNLLFQTSENVIQSKLGLIYKYDLNNDHKFVFKNYFINRKFENKLPFENNGSVSIDRNIFGSTLSFDFNLKLKKINFTNQFGIDYESQKDHRKQFKNTNGIKGTIGFDQNEIFINKSAYFLSNIGISKRMNINISLRYDNINLEAQDFFIGDGNQSGKSTLANLNYSFSLDYKLKNNIQLGFIHSTGFESPTLNELSNNPDLKGGFNLALNPMTSKNYELNIKSRIHKINVQLSLFHINSQNEIIAYELPMQNGRSFYRNAGSTLRNGLEVESSIPICSSLKLNLNYTYSNFSYETFLTFNGKKLPGIPAHMFNTFFELSLIKHMKFNIENKYISPIYLNDANAEVTKYYNESNIKFNFGLPLKKTVITLLAGVNNVFDQPYYSNLRINAAAGRYYEAAPRRNYYIGINYIIK